MIIKNIKINSKKVHIFFAFGIFALLLLFGFQNQIMTVERAQAVKVDPSGPDIIVPPPKDPIGPSISSPFNGIHQVSGK